MDGVCTPRLHSYHSTSQSRCGLVCLVLCAPRLPHIPASRMGTCIACLQLPCPSVGYPANGCVRGPACAGVGAVSHEQRSQAGVRASRYGKVGRLTSRILASCAGSQVLSGRAGPGHRHVYPSEPMLAALKALDPRQTSAPWLLSAVLLAPGTRVVVPVRHNAIARHSAKLLHCLASMSVYRKLPPPSTSCPGRAQGLPAQGRAVGQPLGVRGREQGGAAAAAQVRAQAGPRTPPITSISPVCGVSRACVARCSGCGLLGGPVLRGPHPTALQTNKQWCSLVGLKASTAGRSASYRCMAVVITVAVCPPAHSNEAQASASMYVEGLVTELAGRGQGSLSLLERKLVTLESSSSSLTVPGAVRGAVVARVCSCGCWAAGLHGGRAGQQRCR